MAELPNRSINTRPNRFNRLASRIQRLYNSAKISLTQMKMNFTMENGETEALHLDVHIARINGFIETYRTLLRGIIRSYLIDNRTSVPPYITVTADTDDGFFEYNLFEVYGDDPEEEGADLDHSDEMKEMRKELLAMLRRILEDLKVIYGEEDDPDAEFITVVQPGPNDELTEFQVQQKLQLDLANKFLDRIQMMAIFVRCVVEGEEDPNPDENEGSGPSEHSIGSDPGII